MKNAGVLAALIVILVGLSYEIAVAQLEAALPSLNSLRSVSSLGVGEQGVASRSAFDALQFNPANLVYSSPFQVWFYRNPSLPIINFGFDEPMISLGSTIFVPDIGYFGIEYLNWDEGDSYATDASGPQPLATVAAYERSVAVGYARDLSREFNAGIQLRYARGTFSGFSVQGQAGPASTDKLFISAGLSYESRLLGQKLNTGFSLTNLGTAVVYGDNAQSDPAPSQLDLGASYFAVENDYCSVAVQLEMSKEIVKRDDSRNGQSSFTSLFNDWTYFPNDAALHTGLAFRWKPLDLGNGFSFYQEFYVGNSSTGLKASNALENFYTHGALVGFGYDRYQLSFGYGGRWHNVNPEGEMMWPRSIPNEMFQVALSMNQSPFFAHETPRVEAVGLKHVIISIGAGPSFRVGRYLDLSDEFGEMQIQNTWSYFFESDFYIDEADALVAKVGYNSIPYQVYMNGFGSRFTLVDSKFETIAFSSIYRRHPLDEFRPLYIQSGLGIIRVNPVNDMSPQYWYNTSWTIGAGAFVELGSGVYVVPSVDFTMMLWRVSTEAPGLGGYNQFDVGLKVGYAVK